MTEESTRIVIENSAVYHLISTGVIRSDALEVFHEGTRDRTDLLVFRCRNSGVVFLQSSNHINTKFYARKLEEDVVAKTTRQESVKDADTARRVENFRHLIAGSRWLDAGCGEGRVLKVLGHEASEAAGFDPGGWREREDVFDKQNIVASLSQLEDRTFDIVTLFHVLEHVAEPVEYLISLAGVLDDEGLIVVEVPHARDALLMRYGCEAYRRHTLWSEHLVLHTEASLRTTLEAADLFVESIEYCQRYNLANHLYWLCKGKAGGQVYWPEASNSAIDKVYAEHLSRQKETDTLVAVARKR